MSASPPRVGVACLVVDAGRVLLMRRRGSHGAGTWSTPGGHLDHGESPAACAAREAEEETGVRVRDLRFLAVTNDVFAESGAHYVTVWMRGAIAGGEAAVRSPREATEVGWFDLDALPEPRFLSLANLLAGRSLPPDAWRSLLEATQG